MTKRMREGIAALMIALALLLIGGVFNVGIAVMLGGVAGVIALVVLAVEFARAR